MLRRRQHGGDLGELDLATHERQAAGRRSLAHFVQAPQELRLGDALEDALTERRAMHSVGDGAPDCIIQHDLSRPGLADQAGSKIHRVAQHRVVPPHGPADLTRHDLAQGNADMAEQRRRRRPAEIGRQHRHGALDGFRRRYGAQRIVFVGHGRAEHGHGGVADVLVDRAAVLDDQFVGAGKEAVDDAAHFLRPERARQLGEAAEIGEQHGHLPALGLGCGGRRTVAQVGNGIEQTLAVAERGDPQLPQVIPGEAAQQLGVDMVGVERVGILGQSQAFKPATDVHVVASTSALAGTLRPSGGRCIIRLGGIFGAPARFVTGTSP